MEELGLARTRGVIYRRIVHLARMILVQALVLWQQDFLAEPQGGFIMTLNQSKCRSPADVTRDCHNRFFFCPRVESPTQTQQSSARLSGRGREQGSRVRRARPAGVQAASARQRLGEVRGSHGLSPFQRQLESPLSPSGEDLTAGDILQEHGVSEEGGEGFDGGEGVEDGPLRSAELGMDHRINKQVIFPPSFNPRQTEGCCELWLLFLILSDSSRCRLPSPCVQRCLSDIPIHRRCYRTMFGAELRAAVLSSVLCSLERTCSLVRISFIFAR